MSTLLRKDVPAACKWDPSHIYATQEDWEKDFEWIKENPGKLKVGIIGCGGISHAHMGGYKAIPELVEVVACCDLDGEKAKNYAADLLL